MRFLILGGTQFLGRTVATHASMLGHEVVCAARGISGEAPADARLVIVDRDEPDGLAALAGERFDAVVDVARHPGQVRRAVRALKNRVGHWTFVSTTSVYRDTSTRGQKADTAPVLCPTAPDVTHGTPDTYGAAKVACERAVGADAFICRAGLIVGPGDPTGRFGYWVRRLAKGGEVLAPAEAEDTVQYIDMRYLARWIVGAAARGTVGTVDAIGPSLTRGEFLARSIDALGSSCALTWVSQPFLDKHGVGRGSGPYSLPYPMPDAIGDNARDVSAALGAGLQVRPLAETVRDTLDWMEARDEPVTGLTFDEEAALLHKWHRERRA